MSVVPGTVETDRQPPMTIPLRHFLFALVFLAAGVITGFGSGIGTLGGLSSLAHVHLLLAGWVCVTIMGAMTQFVPVWSGVELHSRTLATRQLQLVVVGLGGFAIGLFTGRLALVPVFGAVMLLGFWIFVYNLARTLQSIGSASDLDVTERHFAIALGFFLLVTTLGILLAIDFVRPVLSVLPVSRLDVVGAHVTLAVFGAVLTTVLGALYQLATMFTQTELHGIDLPMKRFEEIGYPIGVLSLATGRLLGIHVLGVVGGVLVLGGIISMSVILARRLVETRVPWTPMLSRYAVLSPAMAIWALLTLPVWVRDPLSASVLFGAPGTVHLLTFGVIGFVVLGTVYHVVPFIVWVHRYSDLLGFEDVPMIDDLYSDRLARLDFASFLVGTLLIVATDLIAAAELVAAAGSIVGIEGGIVGGEQRIDGVVRSVGGAVVLAGTVAFCWNIVAVLRTHSPYSIAEILFGATAADSSSIDDPSTVDSPPTADGSPTVDGPSTVDSRSTVDDESSVTRPNSGGDLPPDRT
ncbi:hypothetical protein ACERIT_13965 [Halopenitus sp. H-Gu1]|uniref:hypothetical protein n=1 Tax=Halopenitus sp. H-Gu1 TaxID=3242697 RepID=UPI00359E4030